MTVSGFHAEGAGQAVIPRVAKVGDRDIQCVGNARTALLGRASSPLAGEVDAQPVAAHDPERLGMKPELSGEKLQRGCMALA